jgi:hypothetical protein
MPPKGLNDFKMSGISKVSGLLTTDRISPRANKIMDYYIQGLQSKEIAQRLNLTARYVGEIINAPNFQHQLAIRRARIEEQLDGKIVDSTIEAAEQLKIHAKAAAEKLVGLLDSESESTALKSSTEILDRAGVVSQKQGPVANATVVLVDEKSATLIAETLEMDKGGGDGG